MSPCNNYRLDVWVVKRKGGGMVVEKFIDEGNHK